MEEIHYVYGLYSTRKKDEVGMERVKYVGRSSNPNLRLKQHLNSLGKTDSILYRWMVLELSKGFEIKLTILEQCYKHEVVEKEKEWIKNISKHRKLLNTSINDRNSVNKLTDEIKSIKRKMMEQSKIINELTGVKRATGLIKEIHLLDNTRKLNKTLNERIKLLEDYIKNTLNQPLP
jgi:hypothetical protein